MVLSSFCIRTSDFSWLFFEAKSQKCTKQNSDMNEKMPELNGPNSGPKEGFGSVFDALAAITPDQWHNLAKIAHNLLTGLKSDPRLADLLAGVEGEEIVNSVVLAVQAGAADRGKGRHVEPQQLEDINAFFEHLESIVHSAVDNFRRHIGAKVKYEPIGPEEESEEPSGTAESLYCDPRDTLDVEKQIALRDLLRVLFPRVLRALQAKPQQLAMLQTWIECLNKGDTLPSDEGSKFIRYCVRAMLRRQLRQLAADDLRLKNPTGREILP
jgi:hypothetical protein